MRHRFGFVREHAPSISNSILSLRTPFPSIQLAFSPLRHFLGHAHCEKGRKAITSAEKRRNFECQICVLIWYRFRPIPFSSRYSLFRGPYLFIRYTPRDCTAFWPCASGSVRRKGALFGRRNANAAKKVFFLSNPMSLLAIEFMNV